MDTVRVDLEKLYELRDSGGLTEDDMNFVLESAQLLEDGNELDRKQILRIVDLCNTHLDA
jgi:hypothetical protein